MGTVIVSGNEAVLATFSGPFRVYDLVAELWFGQGFKLGMKLRFLSLGVEARVCVYSSL